MKHSRKIVLALALAVTAAPSFAAEPSPRPAAGSETRSERTVIEVIIDILRSPGAIKY